MYDFSVFYSWQADAPADCNKNFIGEALKGAIQDPSCMIPAPRFASGMEGTAGSPEVASIMFQKIDESSIFVADATLVGRIEIMEGGKPVSKKVPNPNVSTELGYAAARLGWDRIICVMNEAPCFGTRYQQPFDMRNRRFPIDYTLSPEDAKDDKLRKAALKELTKWMKKAVVTVEENEFRKVEDVRRRLDIRCLKLLGTMGPKFDSFPDPTPATCAQYPELRLIPPDQFTTAVVRLLELGVLFTNFDKSRQGYAYHWTYLGMKLLVDFNFRKAKKPTIASK